MLEKNCCIAVCKTQNKAESAIKELQKTDFNMMKLSVVGKGYHSDEYAIGFYNTSDRTKFWGGQGAFWGSLWGALIGAAFFWIPGYGPLAVAGPLVGVIIAGPSNATITGGLSVLGAALYSIGTPKDCIITYETAIKADKFLLIAHGTEAEARRASKILKMVTNVALHLS